MKPGKSVYRADLPDEIYLDDGKPEFNFGWIITAAAIIATVFALIYF